LLRVEHQVPGDGIAFAIWIADQQHGGCRACLGSPSASGAWTTVVPWSPKMVRPMVGGPLIAAVGCSYAASPEPMAIAAY
jgi:hypothetical protein